VATSVPYSSLLYPALQDSAIAPAGYSILDSSNKNIFSSGAIPLEEYVQKGNAVVRQGTGVARFAQPRGVIGKKRFVN